jgi:diguanylate cyclase (GGDEF)-like protein
MWNTSEVRSITHRTAVVLSSMLLFSAATAAGATAQTLPGTGVLQSGGVDVTAGPGGAGIGVDAGETGGINAGVGPGGVNLELRAPTTPQLPTTPAQPAPPPQSGGSDPVAAPGGPTTGGAAPRTGTSPRRSAPRTTRDGSAAPAANTAAGGTRSDSRSRPRQERGESAARVESLRAAAARPAEGREDRGGVAPVFDLVERIPAAVRAGLVALALMAIAMWALWVRGRRRLEHNAYQDPDTGVGNMAAFEQVLDREWQRATRYQRPLGLLLLDLEQSSGGARLLVGERDAKDAVAAIGREVRGTDTVARLAPSRFAVICPEAPQGSAETLGRALEHRLEEHRLRCWAGVAERYESDAGPGDLVTRAAAALTQAQGGDFGADPGREPETIAFGEVDRSAAVA